MTRSDARLIGDIEKLIKRKIALDAIEVEEERRPERRPRREYESSSRPVESAVAAPAASPRPSYRAPLRDPFFDKPYEATASDDLPAWDKGNAASAAAPKGLSSYIKPKKKVAALFGAKLPAAALES